MGCPLLISNSVVPSSVCLLIPGLVSELRGLCGREVTWRRTRDRVQWRLPCRQCAGGSPDLEHPPLALMGLGSRDVLRSWNEPVKKVCTEIVKSKTFIHAFLHPVPIAHRLWGITEVCKVFSPLLWQEALL